MTDVRFVDPPDCPDGDWCSMCLMFAKQRIIDLHPELADLHKDGQPDNVQWIGWDNRIILQSARFVALCDMANLGLVPVCWTHVAALQYAAPSRIAAAQVPPPGLWRGGPN